jgi:hypothetical protein
MPRAGESVDVTFIRTALDPAFSAALARQPQRKPGE